MSFALAAPAHAGIEVLDFDSLPSGPANEHIVGDYRISQIFGDDFDVSTGASYCAPECPENGTQYVIAPPLVGIVSNVVIERLDGERFTVVSIDVAEYQVGGPFVNPVGVLTDTGGTNLTVDGANDGSGAGVDFETFVLGAESEDILAFSTVNFSTPTPGARYSIDNVVVDSPEAQVPALPAPLLVVLAGVLVAVAERARRT